MHTIKIQGNTISYFKKEELLSANRSQIGNIYSDTYMIANHIAAQLSIPCPDIALTKILRHQDLESGIVSVQGAISYTPDDLPEISENCLILVSLEDFEIKKYIGTLAHEMRHIWQHVYAPQSYQNHAAGFLESLIHPSEIDADGYAIWYMSAIFAIAAEKAATIICPEEYTYRPKEYQARMEKYQKISRIETLKDDSKSTLINQIINYYTPK